MACPLPAVESHIFRRLQIYKQIILIRTIMKELSIMCTAGEASAEGERVIHSFWGDWNDFMGKVAF